MFARVGLKPDVHIYILLFNQGINQKNNDFPQHLRWTILSFLPKCNFF